MSASDKILFQQKIEIQGCRFLIYLKEVPTRVASGGIPLRTTIRAFIKKDRAKNVVIKEEGDHHARPAV